MVALAAVAQVIRSRRMVRSFSPDPLPTSSVDQLLELSLRAPSAGNTGGTAWVVLDDPERLAAYWDHTTDESWRASSGRWPGLRRAPVAALALASPAAYVARYAEDDKAGSGLGAGESAWPVPYWFGDAAFSVMTLLLATEAAGLGACFLGSFRGEQLLLAALGVPDEWRLFGTVLLGRPDGHDHRSASLDRPRPGFAERVHRRQW
jgi:nitroreductase